MKYRFWIRIQGRNHNTSRANRFSEEIFYTLQRARAKAASSKNQKGNSAWGIPTTNLGRSQSVASGLDGSDLATAAESVAERRTFFEFKTSVTDVRGAAGELGGDCNLNSSLGKGLNEIGTEFLGLRYLDATYGKDKNGGGGGMRRARSTTVTRNTSALEPPKQILMPFMGVPTSGDGKPLIELRSEDPN